MLEELNFEDLTPIEVHIKLGKEQYVLREATGDAACRYRNAMLKCSRMSGDGRVTTVEGLADVEPLLVSLCLFRVVTMNGSSTFQPADETTIRSWPSRIVKQLFEKCKEISSLGEGIPKNAPSSTKAGSV
jgi:hypothetical protein